LKEFNLEMGKCDYDCLNSVISDKHVA